jgi:hypothetical protein
MKVTREIDERNKGFINEVAEANVPKGLTAA